VQVVQHLPSKHKVLSSHPSIDKQQQNPQKNSLSLLPLPPKYDEYASLRHWKDLKAMSVQSSKYLCSQIFVSNSNQHWKEFFEK
jgi:hypothetical protein